MKMKKCSIRKIPAYSCLGVLLSFFTTINLFASDNITTLVAHTAETSVTQQADMKNISGKVTDEEGEAVIGATISIRGMSAGTVTDADGQFTLEVPADATLVISYVGYLTQTIRVGDQSFLEITLVEDLQNLEEVIVIGYGTARKHDVTTAISTISLEDISERPLTSVAEALQGKAAGVQVIQPNGSPGSGMTVRIRGNSSINASNDPLYIVDGTPLTDINHLSPNDIASMQILKDASSAAIYGSRAANGVVLITTKRGNTEEPRIAFNSYVGVSKIAKRIEALNTEQYKEYLKEIGMSSVPDSVTNYTNWFDETFRTGLNQNYQLSFSSGQKDMTYYLSGAYTSDEGIVPNSSFNRFTLRSNVENQIRSWLKIGANLSYSQTKEKTIPNNIGSNRAGVILAVINSAPYLNIWDPENPGQYDNNAYGTRIEPPLAFTSRYTTNRNGRLLGDVNGEISFSKNLKFRTSASMEGNIYHSTSFLDPKLTEWGRTQHGEGYDNRTISQNLQFESILTYDNMFGKHSLNVMAGTTTNDSKWTTANISGQDYINSDIKTLNAANIISQYSGTANYQWRILSYLTRAAYNYDSRYLLTVNFRADGSSKLAPDHRWGYFPSASAAWRISSESFMENVDFIDDLKIRAGWGQTGNQSGISEYAYLQQYSISKQTPTPENPFPGITIQRSNIKNSELTWETTTQTNIGVDLTLFNGRLVFNADYYYKYTRDMLMNVPLPSTAAVSSILRNEGEMSNRGFELNVSSVNLNSELFWSTDFNISFNRNKLEKLALNKVYYFGYVETLRDNILRLEEGQPLGRFYGLKYSHVDPQTGDPVYEDVDGNGQITLDDRTYIGDANPKFIYGMTNTFSYKGFNLNLFLQGSYGNDIFNASRADTEGMYDDKNQSIRVLDRWKTPGQITDVPRATGDQSTLKVSSYYVEDGSYLRLKSLTFSYDVATAGLKRIGIERIQPYFTAQNLFTLTKYKGFDPELNFAGNSSTVQGVDWGTYPNVKTFVFGLNIDF
ncbi:TonB-dependent receptor [uncultured Proteiniphilum sp.]|uniref:SusC/RagA family TonB-linked outer membrane protein n=1 Tax=uncultured Proteiniphilum sp. TaxID=497637 RepID=UPI0026323A77|nr:TonB-dependent receptor [uncultured Proteiniphilum sp.]